MARFLSLLSCAFIATTSSAHSVMQRPIVGTPPEHLPMQRPIACRSPEHFPMQKPVTGESAPVASFGYTKNIGPISWYGMNSSANSLCATGRNQSPINIESGNTTTTNGVWLNVPYIVSAEIENLGNTVEVPLLGMGTMIHPYPNGHEYTLQQLHFHTPSEHHFNGVHAELEMHMVFKDGNGVIAVLSQTYSVSSGPSDPLLASILKNVVQVTVPGSTSTIGPLDFTSLSYDWWNYQSWTYPGSLMTPPCSEGVTWFVSSIGLPVGLDAYYALGGIVGFGARVLQNRYGGENLLMGAGKNLKSNSEI